MFLFRLVFGLLLVFSLLCFAMFVGTRQALWWKRGMVVLKWTLLAAAAAVLILERLAPLL